IWQYGGSDPLATIATSLSLTLSASHVGLGTYISFLTFWRSCKLELLLQEQRAWKLAIVCSSIRSSCALRTIQPPSFNESINTSKILKLGW
ncbi:hypothetical protein ACTXT7_006536, partial [Hymenolepis weldensis]